MAREVTIKISAQDSFSSTMNRYNSLMNQSRETTNRAADSTGNLERGFRRMQQAFDIGIAGAMVDKVVDFAEGFNALGVQVHANRVLFDTLTESIGGNDRVLQMLRASTGGVVTDMNLMAGASQLLRLNIVDNADDLATLTGQIQRLKSPTESTTDAIQNFALMLSNESLLRLDSFGISSANVKRRMDELGMSFREATMAEMAEQVERLGAAGDVAETNLTRLQIRIENFFNQAAENFAIGVESIIGGLDAIVNYSQGNLDWQVAERAQAQQAQQFGATMAEQILQAYTDEITTADGTAFVIALNDYMDKAFAERGQIGLPLYSELEQIAREAFQLPTFDMEGSGMGQTLIQIGFDVSAYRQQLSYAADMTEELNQVDRQRFNILMQGSRAIRQQSEAIREAREEAQRSYSLTSGASLAGQMGDLYASRAGNGFRFFSAEDALQASALKNEIEAVVEEATRLGVLSDEEMQRLKDMSQDAGLFADQIQRGSDAFQNMNLDQLFGREGGGNLGQFGDQLLEVAQGMEDIDPAQIEAIREAFDLASGRENQFSQGMEGFMESLVNLPPADQVTAAQNLIEAMQELAMLGVDPSTVSSGWIERFAGINGDAYINGGDPVAMAREMAALQAAMNSQTGDDDAVMNTDQVRDNVSAIVEQSLAWEASSDNVGLAFEGIGKTLDLIGAKEYPLRFKVTGVDQVLELLRLNIAEMVENAVSSSRQTGQGGRPVNGK